MCDDNSEERTQAYHENVRVPGAVPSLPAQGNASATCVPFLRRANQQPKHRAGRTGERFPSQGSRGAVPEGRILFVSRYAWSGRCVATTDLGEAPIIPSRIKKYRVRRQLGAAQRPLYGESSSAPMSGWSSRLSPSMSSGQSSPRASPASTTLEEPGSVRRRKSDERGSVEANSDRSVSV